MKKKTGIIILLAMLFSIAGCAGNLTDTASGNGSGSQKEEPAQGDSGQPEEKEPQAGSEEVIFKGRKLTGEAAALFEEVQNAAGEELLLFDCADYDGDGAAEAFAFTGTEDNGVLAGRRWFAGRRGAERVETAAGDTEYLQNRSAVVETQEGDAFWYTESGKGSSTTSWLWGVSGGTPLESVLSGKGQDFSGREDGGFLLYQSSLDACADGTGRTVKPCYFYYKDGAFHEYGAKIVGRETFLSLPGASQCISPYENDNYWIRDIWLRGNGLIQVNLRNMDRNKNLTCVWKEGALVTESENDGIAGLLVGELASEEWSGPEGRLSKLWETGCAAEKADGMFFRLLPDVTAWFDLDGDGQPEEIRYTVARGEDGYPAKSAEISIDQKTAFKTDNTVSSDYRLWVTDLDRADGKKELVLQGQEDNDVFSMLKFLDMEGGELKEIGDLKDTTVLEGTGELFRIGMWDSDSGRLLQTPGDGTISLWADTPVYTQGLGCYYVKLAFTCVENGFRQIGRPEYEMKTFSAENGAYSYTAQQAIPFYETCEAQPSDEPAFTAEPGVALNCLMLAPCTNEAVYAKMRRTDTGEEGWGLFSDAQLFTETPAWG